MSDARSSELGTAELEIAELEREILRERTDALSKAKTLPPPAGKAMLAISIGAERYGLPLSIVSGVGRLRRLCALPHAPRHVAGVTLLGTAVLPVFHMHAALGSALTGLPEYDRVVYIGGECAEFALLVQAIEGVRSYYLNELSPVPKGIAKRFAELILGAAPDGTVVVNAETFTRSSRFVVGLENA